MNTTPLQIRMLGDFSISTDSLSISSQDSRSRKIWMVLAYVICHRHHLVTQDELINQLWGDEDKSTNPSNALKTMFHRLRTMLNKLECISGHDLIIRQNGNYVWNTAIPVELDVDCFERLCRDAQAAENEETKMALFTQALELYRGNFLPRFSNEVWVISLATYYHNLYLQAIDYVIPRLEAAGRMEEAASFIRRAVETDPYNEPLYCYLMRELIALGDQQGAVAAYDSISNLLFTNFGVMPSAETRALYRAAMRTINGHTVSILDMQDQLREPSSAHGALYCEYDFFKVLYQSMARGLLRSGTALHICLLSVSGTDGTAISPRSLDHCMENLKPLICGCLRKGDVVSCCSINQYVFLLPQANYENSCMVCERIVKTFCRQYPHSPAQLYYSVQPVEPFV